jgi:PPOX class probable F420-dependent enzyme
MDFDAARSFLATNHRGVLATRQADGSPQLSPVMAGVDSEGRVVISTRQTAYKVRNIRRDPRVWICVMNDAFFGPWIRIAGTAKIVELPEAMEPLVEYYRGISGEHSDWDEYRAAMEAERRVLLRVTITTAGPDRHG